MVAIELVSDRATKKPIDKKCVAGVFETAYREGVMVRGVRLSLPLIISAADVTKIVSAIDAGLSAM